jgi:hypothetical protein
MAYLKLDDAVFDKTLNLSQCYEILYRFICQYNDRGESSTADLAVDVGITSDGSSTDPAQIYDFVRVAGEVLDDRELRKRADPA